MPTFLDELLRMRNVFGQPNQEQVVQGQIPFPQQQQAPQVPMRSPIMNPMQEHVQNMPVRNDPGVLRRILAASAGGLSNIRTPQNAPAMTDRLLYSPYYRELADWQMKGEALKNQGMFDEREGRLQNQAELNEIRRMDLERRAEADSLKAEIAKGKLELDQTNKNISEREKLMLQMQARLEQIEAQGKQTRDTEGVRQTGRKELEGERQGNRIELEGERQVNRVDLANKRGEIQKTVKQTPTAAQGGKAETPANARQRVFNNAQRAKIAHPEWAPYITIDTPNKQVTVATVQGPNRLGFGGNKLTPELRRQIVAAIYPDGVETITEDKKKDDPLGIR